MRCLYFAVVLILTTIPVAAQSPQPQDSVSGSNPAVNQTPEDPLPLEDLYSDLDSTAEAEASSTDIPGPAGVIPFRKGINASLNTSSQHGSYSHWTNILTPDLGLRINRHFSADVSVPIYLYLSLEVTGGTAKKPTTTRQIKDGLFGDTAIAAHYEAPLSSFFLYNSTFTVAFPTGSYADSLGAGQTTYDFNNRFELDRAFSPFVELGVGDASNLVNRRIKRTESSVGPLSHYQAGLYFDLPRGIDLSVSAYEQLPIGDQKLYQASKVKKATVQRVVGVGLAEDNGFSSLLDIPIAPHCILSGYYNRSLRQHEDTAGFSLTFLLRRTNAAAVK